MSATPNQEVTVLHVDDDPDLLELARTFLERESERITVETTTSVSEGLGRLEDGDVDCIVSDYDMPDRNGIDFLEAVREDRPDLPFILFTGKGSEEIASEAITAGVSDYLQKASGSERYALLANRIENVVAKYRAEELVERAFQAMDRAREGIALLDEDGEFIYVNDAYSSIVGYDREELIGEFWELVYPDRQARRIYDEILDTVPADGHWTGESVYQRKDGARVLVNHALTYSEEGTMICLLWEPRDPETSEQALEQERERFELFVQAVEDYAIFMLDPAGYVTSWNNGAQRIKGYTRDEILGEHFSTFYTEDQRAEGLPGRLLERAMQEGSVEHQGPRVRKDGSTFQADVVITPVFDEDDHHRGYAKVTRDVDEIGGDSLRL